MRKPGSAKFNRREFLLLGTAASTMAMAQGIASRGVKPQPRGKPSGLPFLAHFTDVASAAGLTAPTIYGGIGHKQFIFETVGCGVAFFDYDNDGWLDIFVLCGTRVDSAPEATNRLYKNNRDGTFTDVTEKAGLLHTGWASGVTIADYNNDGYDDIFITYYGQNIVYRNNGDGNLGASLMGAAVQLGAAQACQRCSRSKFALEVALETLNGEAAKVSAAAARPGFSRKRGRRRAENANRQNLGIRRQRDAMRPVVSRPLVLQANQAIREQVEIGWIAGKRSTAE
jgi:hypothetical protein